MSTQNFVDDSDAGIDYSAGWTPQTFSAANATSLPVLPHYGTLHSPSQGVGLVNFSYTFTGTSITAWFIPTTPTAKLNNCTIDGHQKGIVFREVSALACQTQSSLAPGEHKLFVGVEPSTTNSLSLDYITYTPSGDSSGEDILYDAGAPSIIASDLTFPQGATLDLEFFGYSLGVYGQFSNEDSHIPSHAVYSVDNEVGGFINVTIQNPTTSSNSEAGPVLVIQTPAYDLARHLFHLVWQGTDETVPFQLVHLVVQNTSSHVNLQPLPFVSSSGQAITPTASSSFKQKPKPSSPASPGSPSQNTADTGKALHIGIAMGVVASVVTVLAIVLYIFFRRRRRRSLQLEESGDPASIARPFIIPRILQIGPAKRRGVEPPPDRTKSSARANRTQVIERPQRVLVHVDSEDQPGELDADEEILELPPAYRSAVQTPTLPDAIAARLFQPPPVPEKP